MRKIFFIVVVALLACEPQERWTVCDAGETANNGCGQCTCKRGRWDCELEQCADLNFKAGFIEIEPVAFTLRKEADSATYISSPAQIWYAFQPADEAPEEKPLAVFFNGGPGASTSGILFSLNTAKRSLDPQFNGGAAVGENPNSWTRFANLLYIDARGSGFSYGLMDNPTDDIARQAEFSTQNFNVFFDGADFVRVVLRFLKGHPSIKKNPVYLVSESFGGVRSTLILHLLLHYRDYQGEQAAYEDPALVGEIQAHLEALHPEYIGQPVPTELIAEQFSHQIMIQAVLSGKFESDTRGELYQQSGSVVYEIAEEEGLTFVPCAEDDEECIPLANALDFVGGQAGRDVYKYNQQADWTLNVLDDIGLSLALVDNLSQAIGIDVTTVGQLAASERENAYRYGAPAFPGENDADFEAVMGPLEEWDAYYNLTNDYVWNGFYMDDTFRFDINPGNRIFGERFLENVLWVKTFVTNSAYDLMVHGPAQPPALALHTDILSSCEHDVEAGEMRLIYLPGAFGNEESQERIIRFPHYSDAGHVIEIDQPADLLGDIVEWLEENP